MKKAIALVAAVMLLAGILTGCGDGNTGATSNTPPAETKLPVRTEELPLESEGLKVYGKMYLPGEEKDKYPLVILSHGFNSNSMLNEGYAESFAKEGYAAYVFDFCGGSPSSQSEGEVTNMSVLTEARDLMNVMDSLKELDYIDADQIFLFGLSQGGFVSAYTAAQRPDDVKGLILFYPAFVLQENCWKNHSSVDDIPETEEMMGVTVGAIYSRDAMSFDIYEEIAKYTKDVLICHGDKDTMVDLSYSERAVEVYESAELKVIQYGEHGFQGKLFKEAAGYAVDYLKAHTD